MLNGAAFIVQSRAAELAGRPVKHEDGRSATVLVVGHKKALTGAAPLHRICSDDNKTLYLLTFCMHNVDVFFGINT